ncbi:MAG: alkaline phosphatase family protein [Flavobacteriales bacterium]|nr:alkaline phosphatase family protein [Flavobacteriales bacterium]
MSTKLAFSILPLLVISLWNCSSSNALVAQLPQGVTAEDTPPKIVVAITVDQMRADYLTRYNSGFGEGGFKRFFSEGFVGMDHHFSYAPTYTGPGHASIATGTTPAVHGIIGNNWFSRTDSAKVYCVEDTGAQPVGMPGTDPGSAGQMSPHRLHSSTWADEFKLHFTQRGGVEPKVIGASMKDRGAILPAGHSANAAYWVSNGQFISSSHYMDELPSWVQEFNDSDALEDLLASGWSLRDAAETYNGSMEDNTPFEGTWRGGERPTFPYDLQALEADNGGQDIIKGTPHGNTLLVDFALAAIQAEQLGVDDIPDVLALSFSSTDYVGHKFGAHAMETEDTYRRLDDQLSRLFAALDNTVGRGQWTAFLTADHGAVTVPGLEKNRGLPVDYWNPEPMKAAVQAAVSERFGRDDLIRTYDNDQFFLDRNAIRNAQLDADQIARFAAGVASGFPAVQRVLTAADLRIGSFTEGAEANVQRGWHATASGDVVVMLKPGYLEYSRTGTSHGSPYAYDTHVPFLMMGPGVPQVRSYERSEIRDIAPTLSALLGFPRPSACTGQPILDLFSE